jgi:hypothetical protein
MSLSMGAMIAQRQYAGKSATRPLEARSRQGRTEAQLLLSCKQSLDSEAIDYNLDQSESILMELKPFGWVRNMFRREPKAPQRSSAGNPGGHPAFSPGQAWGAWGARTATSTASPTVDSAVPYNVGGSAGAARLLAAAGGRKSAAADAKKVANGRRPNQTISYIDKSYEDIDRTLVNLKGNLKYSRLD